MSEPFRKDDKGKPDLSLLPPRALLAVGRVLSFGAAKYGRENWANVPDPHRYEAAALRHLMAHLAGETADADTKESHLAHAACCVLFLLELEARRVEVDARLDALDAELVRKSTPDGDVPPRTSGQGWKRHAPEPGGRCGKHWFLGARFRRELHQCICRLDAFHAEEMCLCQCGFAAVVEEGPVPEPLCGHEWVDQARTCSESCGPPVEEGGPRGSGFHRCARDHGCADVKQHTCRCGASTPR